MASSLVSCINDSYDENIDCMEKDTDRVSVNRVDTIGYMSIGLQMSDGSTRASKVGDEFAYGEDEEFSLASGEHHFAIFYKEGQDTPVAIATLSGMANEKEGELTSNTTVVFATIAVKSEQKRQLEELSECIVLLNVNINGNEMWTKTKKSLLNTIVESPYYESSTGRKFFTMCNSVYIDGDGKKIIASEVDTDKIYTSYMEALEQAWKGNAAVTAYVERLTARFTLEFSNCESTGQDGYIYVPENNQMVVFSHINDNGIPYYDEATNSSSGYSYKIKITGWGVNALEQKHFLFRNINVAGNYFANWYSSENHRVYWSEDCNYTKATYPWQYRQAIDEPAIPYYKGQDNILRNRSFSELDGFQKYAYSPENTYNFADADFSLTLDSRVELLAGTHVIVCAQLLTNLDDVNSHVAKDVYRDRNGTYYRSEEDCFKSLVCVLNNTVSSRSFLKFRHYDWTKGGGNQTLYAKTDGSYYLYYNGTKLTPAMLKSFVNQNKGNLMSDATLKNGDGKRLVWMDGMEIKDDAGKPLQIYTNIDEVDPTKDIWLREATTDDVKSLIYEYIGAVDHFNEGKMYYAIPVGFIKNGTNADGTDKYSVYGVVRNCAYSIVVTDVTGLGTSVDNIDEPIVPNKVSTHDHLFVSFEILNWHVTEESVWGTIQ